MNDTASGDQSARRPGFNGSALGVWWTSEEDCRIIGEYFPPLTAPVYIMQKYRSRVGRNGRGRLWISELFPQNLKLKMPEYNVDYMAGIVIYAADAQYVAYLPGRVQL